MIALICLGILVGIFQVPYLTYVENAEAYNFMDEDEITLLKNREAAFDSGTAQSIIILKHQTNWNSYTNLKQLADLTNFLSQSVHKHTYTSIASIELPEKFGTTAQLEPLIDLSKTDTYEKWLKKAENFQDITSKFLSSDGQYALIYYDGETIPHSTKTILKSIQDSRGIGSVYFFETGQFNSALRSTAIYNLIQMGVLAVLLIGISFFLFTRSLKGFVLLLTIITFNLAMVVIIMSVAGIQIGPHLSAVPSIVAVMSFSDVMHIFYHHHKLNAVEGRENSTNSKLRKQLFGPLLLTSFTNSIGFIVYLIVAQNIYLSDLGFISLFGVIIAYFSAKTFVIALLQPNSNYFKPSIAEKIELSYNRQFKKLTPHKSKILTSFSLIVVGLLIAVIFSLKTESTSRAFVSKDSNMAIGQGILEEHFFGNQTATIYVRHQHNEPLYTPEIAFQIQEVEEKATEILSPLYVSGPLNVLRRYNRFRVSGHSAAYRLPKNFSPTMAAEFRQIAPSLGWNQVVDSTGSFGKIDFGFNQHHLSDRLKMYGALQKIIPNDPGHPLYFSLSGKSFAHDNAESKFIHLVLFGFLLAFLIAGIIMVFILKSISKSVFFILVNALPLLFALALMLIFDIPINTVSVFMLSILVGLCLDDSIYLITLNPSAKNISGIYPIVVTTVVLAIGMLALSMSTYTWLQPFSFIFFGAFLVSLFADIIILPLLIKPTPTAPDK